MVNHIKIWLLNKELEFQTDLNEPISKISNIESHLYLLTNNNNLYHGVVSNIDGKDILELKHYNNFKLVDIACYNDQVFVITSKGEVYRCNSNLDIINEIVLAEDYLCSRSHSGGKNKMKVKKVAVNKYGQLFITENGHLWASGYMPQININSEFPRRVQFFIGKIIYNVDVGHDFAIAIVNKAKNDDFDSDEEEVFATCPQCISASQLTSPTSQNSLSEMTPLGIKIQGSYDIETTSTSSKNDSSVESNENRANFEENSSENNDTQVEKNIIFRNTEAARDFLTKQISRMSSAGEEYLVECTEKPTRIIKENVTNVASLVYEGVKTVGDKVATLSRHVSGSSDCNSIIENSNAQVPRTSSKDEFVCSLSQCTSEKDLSEQDLRENVHNIIRKGSQLLNCEIWTWGNIIHGQLGIGDNIKRERPMIITKLSNIGVQKVSVQSFHAAVITLDGRAYIWGRNDFHQVTIDSNSDQSSPKLYPTDKNERVKDVVCGKYFTMILNNKKDVIYYGKNAHKEQILYTHKKSDNHNSDIPLFHNLLSSEQFTVLNLNKSDTSADLDFLVDIQILLEELLVVQANLIKPLQKKSTNSLTYGNLFDKLCKEFINFMNLIAVYIQSLLEYENKLVFFCDTVIFKNFEENILIFKAYMNVVFSVVSIDGFTNISKIIEIPQTLYKLKSEVNTKKDKNKDEMLLSALFLSPIKILHKILTLFENFDCSILDISDRLLKLRNLIDDFNVKLDEAKKTREFWLGIGKNIDFLKSSDRRLIRESHSHPISYFNASRFSTHHFILFNDLFVHMVGSTPFQHNLSTIWLELQQDETSQVCQLTLKMPEDTIILCSTEAEEKIGWFHKMQTAIKNALNKYNALQPPSVRNGNYTFTKNGFFKDATYQGRWLNAKMHGKGKLEWPDGKLYSGQFSNNQLCGYGNMHLPNIGTYEGYWKDNQQNGYGILTYTNTDIYRGHFKDGQPHGHGFLRKGNFMASAASFYIGDWANGLKNGYGVLDDIVIGEKYIGSWMDNKKHGNGLIITSDGVYYEGVFSQDVLIGHGIMILDDGTYYEGEFKGTGFLNGKGVLTLSTGHSIEGTLNGYMDDGIKISNAVLTKSQTYKEFPKSFQQLCVPLDQKWKALFKHYYQSLDIPENNKNGVKNTADTQRIWQNVAVVLSNATNSTRDKGKQLAASLKNLDIIPPYGREILTLEIFYEIKRYLKTAFESSFHPLGALLNDIAEAYTTTYGGRAHHLLLNHAISELHYIMKKFYEIIRHLFPALPVYNCESFLATENGEELISFHSILYPLILPKVYHPLFTLITTKNEPQERLYKRTLAEWNKQPDFTLMSFFSVDEKFLKADESIPTTPVAKNEMFLEGIETLQQLKSTFSPTEKMIVIRQTVERMTPVAQSILGNKYVWNMDDLFPIFLFVVVRARIPELGSELDFMENFMAPSLEVGELGIMFTTLRACYQQILLEKSIS